MKLEAVIVCINYSDFLRITLPNNRWFFNKVVVVTTSTDKETQAICEMYYVQCIICDEAYENNSVIPNKAIAINKGLKALDRDGWVLQLDADIWLPPLFRMILEKHPLNPRALYGIDRLMCNSYKEWYTFIHSTQKLVHEGWVYLHMHFEVGTRIVAYNKDGYLPIGFFQLWNPRGSDVYHYPIEQEGFDRTDLVMARKFPQGMRFLFPDIVCIHLASEQAKMGVNWLGRKTRKFVFSAEEINHTPIEVPKKKKKKKKHKRSYFYKDLEK